MDRSPLQEHTLTRARRRILLVLFGTQSVVSAGVIALATVSSILGAELTGSATWSGVPTAILQLTAAGAAFVWGVLWDRAGRRLGFSLALAFGVLGAVLTALSIEAGSVPIFVVGLFAIGATRAAAQLSRFIAAEVTPSAGRGRAISIVVLGGTVGAIGGPLLVSPSSRWAEALGLNALTGPVALATPLFALGTLLAFLGLRPEPLELGRRLAAGEPAPVPQAGRARPPLQLLRLPGVYVAVITVVLAQMVMVMLMGITSLYMRDRGHTLEDISLVFSAHTLGMFAFSLLSGRLADRVGRGPVMAAGALMVFVSTVMAPLAGQTFGLALALFLLGLGWNFCFVAGSALLADQLTPAERSRTQGANDLLIGLVSGLGGLGSGVLYAAQGYGLVSALGSACMVLALGLSVWWVLGRRRLLAAGTG